VYFTDRGIEELASRRGEDVMSMERLADALRTFVDEHPEFETAIDRLATWLARLDDDEGWDAADDDGELDESHPLDQPHEKE
jgi:hypothetical protein